MSNQKISELRKELCERRGEILERRLRCDELNREVAAWMEKEKMCRRALEMRAQTVRNLENIILTDNAEIKALKWCIEKMIGGKA